MFLFQIYAHSKKEIRKECTVMNKSDLTKQVLDIISNHRGGVLSTVENNKPHSRYMTFYNDDLTLYSPTKMSTEKLDEIEKNPFVSVLLGYEEKGQSDAYVQISGSSKINNSQILKSKLWDESFTKWFDSPEDPNYVFIEIQPEIARILNHYDEPPQELNFLQ